MVSPSPIYELKCQIRPQWSANGKGCLYKNPLLHRNCTKFSPKKSTTVSYECPPSLARGFENNRASPSMWSWTRLVLLESQTRWPLGHRDLPFGSAVLMSIRCLLPLSSHAVTIPASVLGKAYTQGYWTTDLSTIQSRNSLQTLQVFDPSQAFFIFRGGILLWPF